MVRYLIDALDMLGVLTPFLAASSFLIPLLSLVVKRKWFYDAYVLVIGSIVLYFTYNILKTVISLGKPIMYRFGGWPPPLGIVYEVDLFNGILGLFTALTMWFIIVYSIWYTKHMDNYVWYYTLLLGLETGLLGCLYTGDIFNLFVMIEVLSISAYSLVAYYRSKPQAIEAAIKYAMIGAIATTFYFLSIVFIYGCYGTLNMADLMVRARIGENGIARGIVYGNIAVASAVAIGLALWAFTFKSALFPNHFWLPDAHPEAPTPVSAALSGLVVNIGVYAVIRFLYTIFGSSSILSSIGYRDAVFTVLLILGILSGIIGALLMIAQKDIKRLLAYSTISHIGLIYIGLSIGFSNTSNDIVVLGLLATLYHIINHGVGKALLFMVSGLYISSAGTRDLEGMVGVGRTYPIASTAFVLGILHLMGFIPFGGFFSKLLLFQAHIGAGLIVSAISIILVSAISLIGYIKMIYLILLRMPSREYRYKANVCIEIMLLIMGISCLLLGLFSFKLMDLFSDAVSKSLVMAYDYYANPVVRLG